MGTNYHPPKLVKIPSKGDKWFVVITKPVELQGTNSNIQVRRSTKTTDRRKAEAALPGIASAIYQEFDTALLVVQKQSTPIQFHYLSDEEVLASPVYSDPFMTRRMLPPLEPRKDPSTKLSRFIPIYLAYLEERQVGNRKERNTRRTKCVEFMTVVGDLHLEDIKKVHAYNYADWMNAKSLANKTIKSAISRVSMLLVHAEQKGLIEKNLFTDLVLANYGKASLPYLPFGPEEMKHIFAQEMSAQDRLALTLLATTGARLDEIALLEWPQVMKEHGITYLDLRIGEILKNDQSRRIVPIHSKVAPLLAKRGTGRIFDYRKDFDGKAESDAGKNLAVYIRKITRNPRKVVHSFRGTFKDMLKNAGVTALMVEQLEAGEVVLSEIADAIISGQVSKELNDRITGHAMPDVAGKYGIGHALIPRAAAIEKLALTFLPDAASLAE